MKTIVFFLMFAVSCKSRNESQSRLKNMPLSADAGEHKDDYEKAVKDTLKRGEQFLQSQFVIPQDYIVEIKKRSMSAVRVKNKLIVPYEISENEEETSRFKSHEETQAAIIHEFMHLVLEKYYVDPDFIAADAKDKELEAKLAQVQIGDPEYMVLATERINVQNRKLFLKRAFKPYSELIADITAVFFKRNPNAIYEAMYFDGMKFEDIADYEFDADVTNPLIYRKFQDGVKENSPQTKEPHSMFAMSRSYIGSHFSNEIKSGNVEVVKQLVEKIVEFYKKNKDSQASVRELNKMLIETLK